MYYIQAYMFIYKFKNDMNSVVLQNVPGLPGATVANSAPLCENLSNRDLKHQEKQDKDFCTMTGQWYFVLQESAPSRLRVDHEEWIFSSLPHFFFYSIPPWTLQLTPVSHRPNRSWLTQLLVAMTQTQNRGLGGEKCVDSLMVVTCALSLRFVLKRACWKLYAQMPRGHLTLWRIKPYSFFVLILIPADNDRTL